MLPSKSNPQLTLFADSGDKVVKTSIAFSNSHGFDLNQNAYKIFLECLFDIRHDEEEFPITVIPVRKIIRRSGGRDYEYARAATKELASVIITIDRIDHKGKRSTAHVPLMEFSLYEEGLGYIKSRFNRSQKSHLLKMTDEVDGLRSDLENLDNFVQFKIYYLLSQHFGIKDSHRESKEDLFSKLNIKRGGSYEEWRYFNRDLMNKISAVLQRTRMAFEFESDGHGTNWNYVTFHYVHKPTLTISVTGPTLSLPAPGPSLPEPEIDLAAAKEHYKEDGGTQIDIDTEEKWPEWAKTLQKKGFFVRTIKELMHKVNIREIELPYIGYVVSRVEKEFPAFSRQKKANAMYDNIRDKSWIADYRGFRQQQNREGAAKPLAVNPAPASSPAPAARSAAPRPESEPVWLDEPEDGFNTQKANGMVNYESFPQYLAAFVRKQNLKVIDVQGRKGLVA